MIHKSIALSLLLAIASNLWGCTAIGYGIGSTISRSHAVEPERFDPSNIAIGDAIAVRTPSGRKIEGTYGGAMGSSFVRRSTRSTLCVLLVK